MAKFSVIIPLYNKEKYITHTLKSILQQDFTDFEVILIDDASTDDSFLKAKKFTDPRIRFFQNKKNQGLSATRNMAIAKATTENIALLDADDVWEPKHLEHLRVLMETYPSAKIYGTNYREQVGKKFVPIKTNLTTKEDHFLIPDFFTASLHQSLVCPSSTAFKKEVFDSVGGFDENILVGEDTDFLIKANLKFKMAYHNTPTCSYTLFSENQITTSFLGNKKIPDFSFFQKTYNGNKSLIKFIDFQRYTYALKYKAEGSEKQFQKIISQINLKNLNSRQVFLLKSPRFVYKILKTMKIFLLKKSVRLTSF